jgi:hypothetical protein
MFLFVERISATFDERTLRAIRRVAGPRGVSRFLQVAARERLARLELSTMLDELDDKFGAVSAEIREEVVRDAGRIFKRRRS